MKKNYYNQGWFGRHPEIYDKTDFFMKYIRKNAARVLDINANQRILDIATGTGAQGYEFSQLGHYVVGIDLDFNMVQKAQKKTGRNLIFIHGDGTTLPLSAKSFDAAVISFAMHDVPYAIGIKILREASRIIKDPGIIFIVEHGDPRKSAAAKLLYWIALTFETPNHKLFLNRKFEEYLEKTGLYKLKEDFLVFGAIRLLSIGKIL